MSNFNKIMTCLWFESKGLEAAEFYTSLIPDSHITDIFRPDDNAPPLLITFSLSGVPYQIINGGKQFQHSEAASIVVMTDSQSETDDLWQTLTSNGGQESQCGWLKDRFGVSWQVVPRQLPSLLSHSDKEAAQRAMNTMLTMHKIDMSAIQAAFDNQEA